MLMPIMYLVLPSQVMLLLFMIIWILMSKKWRYGSMQQSFLSILPIYFAVFILQVVKISFLGGSNLFLDAAYDSLFALFLPLMISAFVIQNRYEELAKKIVVVVLLMIFVTSITTYYGNMLFPNASRALATGEAELSATYTRYNIAGFDYVYINVLLIPLIVYRFKYISGKKLFPIILLAIMYMMIFKTSYTTALLLSVLGLFSYFLKSRLTTNRIVLYLLCFAIAYFLVKNLLPPILNGLADLVDNENISPRLNDLANVFMGNDVYDNSDIGSRKDLYLQSFTGFLSNPIIGTQTVGGGHSFILDSLCCWGIFGLCLFGVLLSRLYKFIIKQFQNSSIFNYSVFTFILLLIMLFLNPRLYSFFVLLIWPIMGYESMLLETNNKK